MKNNKIIPIILCGGSGSRLWPLSRASFPKQYIQLLSDSKRSILQETILRISQLKNVDQPIFICNQDHRFILAEQMREINIKPKSIILEPVSKNTAPAIALAALKVLEECDEHLLLILSSDHLIKNKDKFIETIERSIALSENGKLVTFGVNPTYPETGYGYIEAGDSIFINNTKCFSIKKFLEKPDIVTAKKFIKDDRYFWNSGIFLFQTKIILKELQKNEPEMIDFCRESLELGFADLEFQRLNKHSFEKCKNISIDISIMEKTNLGVVMPLDLDWSDLGSWQSIWENEEKDKNGNVISGKVVLSKVKNSYIKSDNRLIVCNKLDNIVIVETNDAILISNKSESQNLKQIVNKLVAKGYSEASEHKRIYRPWGNYLSIAADTRWQVKMIEVKPGSQLSLQMHHHRAEHWVVVKGIAKVTIEDKIILLKENESTFIPLGSKHRLANPGNKTLILIEVQSGTYVGEDDIIRFQDDYGRN